MPPSQPISDAVVEIRGLCRHSLRFAFSAPIGLPYAAVRLPQKNPPPALFRRVQVAAPPPRRDGAPWETGLVVGEEAFAPDAVSRPTVEAREGAVSLDQPDPDGIVLDWWFRVPRLAESEEITLPGDGGPFCFLSVPYWQPESDQPVTIDYFTEKRLPFRSAPRGEWIAISFDAFWPPERDSADVIARLGECDSLCP
jgi:hypothetical protein